MPSDRDHRYDAVPPIPTYDEAVADIDDRTRREIESQSLLSSTGAAASSSSSRRNGRYRAPTVETDDEDSLFSSDDDGDETAYVRREMQELEIGEPEGSSRSSIWGKRIPFSLSLPRWKWSWRFRMPNIRPTIHLPSGPPPELAGETNSAEQADGQSALRRRCAWPKFEGTSRKTVAIAMVRIFAGLVIISFLYFVFVSDVFSRMARRLGTGFRFDPEEVRMYVLDHVKPTKMRDTVKHFSSYAHLAGTEGDYALAMDMENMLSSAGVDFVKVDEYEVYLNYPTKDGRAVQILDKDGKKAEWSARLEERGTGEVRAGHQTYSFHGHSKSGDVKGPLIYANYGSREDFKALKDKGIDTKGAIALVRYYGTQPNPSLKVKAAELAGFAGCLIYSDPADDGFKQGDVAPHGRFMPKDGVHKGSVSLMSYNIGDPLTPGWGSKKGLPRMKVDQTPALVQIPSLPLSWGDAQTLLQRLKGHGEKVPDGWKGGVGEVEWYTGDSSSPIVRLKNEQDVLEMQPIWNIYGKIEGMEQTEKSVLIGNHRDSLAFGATDPHSGTAVMLEVARIFGILLSKGWRPLRSIEFMSWDGGEYNLVGSTEYVEYKADDLRRDALAYVNLDGVVAGAEFHAAGSPVFQKTIHRVMDRISDPAHNKTLRQLWKKRDGELESLGGGGDFMAFQDIAGVSSIDLDFRGPRFPLHSSYDNFDMVDRFGDPAFNYHGLMAQVVTLLVLELADRPIVPFDFTAYGEKLDRWVDDLISWSNPIIKSDDMQKKFSLEPLKIAVHEIRSAASTFSQWENIWDSLVLSSGGWESATLNSQRMQYNDRAGRFESALLDLEQNGGIPNRTQFKHVIYGPDLWSGYDVSYFPAIRDTIAVKDWSLATEIVKKTAKLMRNAAHVLLEDNVESSNQGGKYIRR